MANEEVLRLKTTFVSEESLANIRALGREIGVNLPAQGKKGSKELETGFKGMTEAAKRFGEQLTKIIPGLEEFGLGAASAAVGGALLIRTLTNISGKIVELQYASKELGMSERDLRAWGLAAEKAGIAPDQMMSGLKDFKRTADEFKYNIGGVRDELVSMGAGPVVARIMNARTETDKLKQAFDFKEALMKSDPSGYQARKFFEMIGLGADAARLSFEGYEKAREHIKPLTPEEQAQAKKFHDDMILLAHGWEQLLQKTAIKLFPMMAQDIKDVEAIIGLLEKIDALTTKWFGGGGSKGDLMGHIVSGMLGTSETGSQTGPSRAAAARRRRLGIAPRSAPSGEHGAAPEHHSALDSGYKLASYSDGFGGGGNLSEFSKAVKDGVFAALVDFKTYVETGAAAGGGNGMMNASFGGTPGAAAGGGVPSGGLHSGGGYSVIPNGQTPSDDHPASGGGRRGLARALGMDRGGGARRVGGGGGGRRRVGGSDGGPGSEGSTTPPSGNLAAQRAGFQKELEADPQLKSFAIDAMQHEGGIQSNMEQLFNYAAMRHMTIRQALHSGQYGPVKHGLISGNISAKTRQAGEAALKSVYGGSNITDYATDQGMAGDPNFAKYMSNRDYWHMHKVQGAWFSSHGEPGRRWAEQQKAADARAATSRIDGAVNNAATGGTPVNGQVAVNITSNGTAAKADTKTSGELWQQSTVRNYKQMQKTEAGAGGGW